jgi:hypothetical protein
LWICGEDKKINETLAELGFMVYEPPYLGGKKLEFLPICYGEKGL